MCEGRRQYEPILHLGLLRAPLQPLFAPLGISANAHSPCAAPPPRTFHPAVSLTARAAVALDTLSRALRQHGRACAPPRGRARGVASHVMFFFLCVSASMAVVCTSSCLPARSVADCRNHQLRGCVAGAFSVGGVGTRARPPTFRFDDGLCSCMHTVRSCSSPPPLRTDEVDDGLVVRVGVHDSDAGVERICNLRHAGGGTGSTSPPFAHAHIGAQRRTCPSECRAVRWVGWAQTAGRAEGTAICTRNHTALSTYTADPMSEGMMIACRN